MASFTKAEGKLIAYEALRELVRKVECGEIEILDMNMTQDAPETRDFQSVDGRTPQRMLLRNGDLTVELKLAWRGARAESRDDYGRLRGDVGVPRDPRNGQFGGATSPGRPPANPWSEADWNVAAQARYLKDNGPARAADMARAAGVLPYGPRDNGVLQGEVLTRAGVMKTAGISPEEYKRIEDEISRESGGPPYLNPGMERPTLEGVNFPRPQTTQAPVDPLNYGARKVDID